MTNNEKLNRSLERIVKYLYEDEKQNWQESERPSRHIFNDVYRVKEHLNNIKKHE